MHPLLSINAYSVLSYLTHDEPEKRTRCKIGWGLGLSVRELLQSLDELISHGLIRFEEDWQVYNLTSAGREWLQQASRQGDNIHIEGSVAAGAVIGSGCVSVDGNIVGGSFLGVGPYKVSDVKPLEVASSTEKVRIRLSIEGDISEFDKSTLVAAISGMCGVESEQVDILMVEAGSISVEVEMPVKAAELLYELAIQEPGVMLRIVEARYGCIAPEELALSIERAVELNLIELEEAQEILEEFGFTLVSLPDSGRYRAQYLREREKDGLWPQGDIFEALKEWVRNYHLAFHFSTSSNEAIVRVLLGQKLVHVQYALSPEKGEYQYGAALGRILPADESKITAKLSRTPMLGITWIVRDGKFAVFGYQQGLKGLSRKELKARFIEDAARLLSFWNELGPDLQALLK
ncbi:MAG: hypothetical protein JXB47_11870 [Anaerolineae bacterium]|nr:hypothetical protein [Anaerolineae bacterium]